ncbi:PREDICTED: basic salivary proline-rich protein 2-like [Capra hircus]|uniref:basic salivary proline-rich protein 2-like n=1 Tax=Capra hircus TaxID=9925 RepID=UPI000846ACB7|nr:PREDICTED: basic salivary proline-rich protein 2-like [Capra hircus]
MIPPKLPIFICHRGRAPRGFPDAALESADRSPPSPAQSEAGCPGQEPDRVPAPGGRARDAASSGPGTAGPFIVPGRAPSRRVRAASRENGAPRPRRQGEQGVACHPSGKLPPRPTGRLALDGPGPRTAGHPHLRGPAPAPPRRRRSAQRSRGRGPNPDSSPATSSGRFPKLNPFLCQLRAAPPRRQLSSPNFGARGPARRPGRDEGKEGAAATSRRGAAAGPADGEDVGFTQRARSADAPPHGVRARHNATPNPGAHRDPPLAQVRDRGDGGRHRRRGRGRQGDVSLPARPGPARPRRPDGPARAPPPLLQGPAKFLTCSRRRGRESERAGAAAAAAEAGERGAGQASAEKPPPKQLQAPRSRRCPPRPPSAPAARWLRIAASCLPHPGQPFIEPPFPIGSHPATPSAAGQSERRRPNRGGAHWARRRASASANGRGEELRGAAGAGPG